MVIIQGVDAACAGRNRTTATSVAFKLGHIADAVDERNRRWCSDGFEIGCDNGERVPVAFALDCCDREAMSFLAATSGISGDDVREQSSPPSPSTYTFRSKACLGGDHAEFLTVAL